MLFAIVLGLAALATSVSRSPREATREPRLAPPASGPAAGAPGAAPQPESAAQGEVRLPTPRGRHSVALRPDAAASLLVSVPVAGRIDLPTLGLSSPAEPLTPARFELLLEEPATHEVRFTPAEDGETRRFGRVVVR